METDGFTPFDPRGGAWSRALTAARVSGTLLLLISGVIFWLQWASIPRYAEIFENMVSGGSAGMPALTVNVLNYSTEIIGAGGVLGFGALAYVLAMGRDPARVIAVSTTAVLLLLGTAFLIHFAMNHPLQIILTKFNG